MEIDINEKTYKFNRDLRFGVLIRLQDNPESLQNLHLFLREVLIPTPSKKEIYNFRESDIERISIQYEKFKKENATESKKKLSLL